MGKNKSPDPSPLVLTACGCLSLWMPVENIYSLYLYLKVFSGMLSFSPDYLEKDKGIYVGTNCQERIWVWVELISSPRGRGEYFWLTN